MVRDGKGLAGWRSIRSKTVARSTGWRQRAVCRGWYGGRCGGQQGTQLEGFDGDDNSSVAVGAGGDVGVGV